MKDASYPHSGLFSFASSFRFVDAIFDLARNPTQITDSTTGNEGITYRCITDTRVTGSNLLAVSSIVDESTVDFHLQSNSDILTRMYEVR
jgi:hypothetical protein